MRSLLAQSMQKVSPVHALSAMRRPSSGRPRGATCSQPRAWSLLTAHARERCGASKVMTGEPMRHASQYAAQTVFRRDSGRSMLVYSTEQTTERGQENESPDWRVEAGNFRD